MSDVSPLFDRQVYLARQARAKAQADGALGAHLADELADRLAIVARHFDEALLVASDPAPYEAAIRRSGKVDNLQITAPAASDHLHLEPESLNAIITMADLHAVNDLPGQLAQMRRALKPDGMLLAALFGGETLTELRQSWLAAEGEGRGATLRVAPMVEVRALGGLLQRAGLALPVVDGDRLVLRHADALALMREIKAFGFANPLMARARGLTAPATLARAAQIYHQAFADADGRVRATLEVIWAIAWAPDASQPKPARPGSATMRLADVLNARKFPEGSE